MCMVAIYSNNSYVYDYIQEWCTANYIIIHIYYNTYTYNTYIYKYINTYNYII